MMRLLNIFTASVTCGSEAATIEAIDQIGLVSARCWSTYQTMVEAMKTLMAKRTPALSCRTLSIQAGGHLNGRSASFIPCLRAVVPEAELTPTCAPAACTLCGGGGRAPRPAPGGGPA